MQKTNYSLISLGCARAQVDSESMINDLNHGGFTLVPEGSTESITILNTCSFIQAAIDETESNIDALITQKSEGRLKHLVVVGCYPSRFKETELKEKYPEVDLWLSTKSESQLQARLAELVFEKKYTPEKPKPYTKLTPSHFAYLKISEGCDNWCAFCTIPKIRGKHTSLPIEKVIETAKLHIAMGAKELNLIAEDTTAWGEDLYGKHSFPKLLNALTELQIDWIRPMYIYPTRVDAVLIDTLKKHQNITNYIDIPIQHVSTKMLEAMRRKHDKAHLEKIFDQFLAAMPNLALRTTFILGFPGETEEDVEEICDFITKYPFAHIGCFAYSDERETKAHRLPNKVPTDTTQARISRVMETQYKLITKRHEALIGTEQKVLFEGNRRARTEFQAPDVDGIVILDNDTTLTPGEFYQAKITGTSGYDLTAKV